MLRITSAAFALLLCGPAAAAPPPSVPVKTVAPRPEDVSSLDGMLKAFYDVISGPAGAPRDWARDRTLYIPDVRFVSMSVGKDGKPHAEISSHQRYVESPDGPVFARGINSVELFHDGARWWIASAIWDGERPDNPIPADLLPRGGR